MDGVDFLLGGIAATGATLFTNPLEVCGISNEFSTPYTLKVFFFEF